MVSFFPREAWPLCMLGLLTFALALWQSRTELRVTVPLPDENGTEVESAATSPQPPTPALTPPAAAATSSVCSAPQNDSTAAVTREASCSYTVVPLEYLKIRDFIVQQAGRHWRRRKAQEERRVQAEMKEAACQYTFRRYTGSHSGDFDLFINEHTPVPTKPLFGSVQGPEFRWCGPKRQFTGCRACGYSCNMFGFMYADEPALSSWRFPYPSLKGPVKVWVKGHKRDRKKKGPEKCRVRCGYGYGPVVSDGGPKFRRPWLEVHHGPDNREAGATALRMGYAVSEGLNWTGHGCSQMVDAPTVFFGKLEWPNLARDNFAHWTHDAFFPLFMNIVNQLGFDALPKAPGDKPGYVVVTNEADFRWFAGAGLGWLMELLAPVRMEPREGLCFSRAYFDCPKPATMKPQWQFQHWLQGHGMSFRPLPVVDSRPHLVIMVRQVGGTRYIANWEKLRQVAEQDGFRVTVPLDPTKRMYVNDKALLKDKLVGVFQSAHCVIGMHGSELALMPLIPNRSVIVEICPTEYRYLDPWYIDQADAHGLTLIRWAPSNATTVYGEKAPKEDKYTAGWWRGRQSDFHPHPTEMRELLRAVRRLIS
eukprot:TRINITY_DN32820_c0_g1_i1.p1 TRINITY_DN32820_c0_g1~~TRINITY_DN32820_c0_g1_i1.p1  ORF type:complete len:592 (+),score=167.02 TRINITY_DN32820_c0_g1_i1:69-1844(+)